MGICSSAPLDEQPRKSSRQPLQQTRENPEKAAELQQTRENPEKAAERDPAVEKLGQQTVENSRQPVPDSPEIAEVENYDDEEVQAKLKIDGNFMAHDWLDISKEVLQDKYEEKLKKYYEEHLHTDPEIRLIVAGSGYFEVRDANDKWIRLRVTPGTLINLPAGMYHRLTLDSGHYIKMLRLFAWVPAWEAINRPEGDTLPVRLEYLAGLNADAPVAEA